MMSLPRLSGRMRALQIAEKLGFWHTAPKGASQFKGFTASLKRCPDTKLEFFSNLFTPSGQSLHTLRTGIGTAQMMA